MNLFRATRVRPVIEQMEPRILYSADLNPALASNPALIPQFEQRVVDASGEFTYFAEANAELTRQEVVFVDTATPDYQALVDGIHNNEESSNNFDVVLLDSNADGISQISEYLATRQDVSAIHIVSHGSDAAFQLGKDVLDAQSLTQNAEQISLWGNALTADADLMIYGCDVAQSDAGRALIDSLAHLTGADVAASTDLTGNAARGGDWELEYARGDVETAIAFGSDVQQNWFGILPTAAITARETVDSDGNGQIDHIKMTAEGALNDDFSDINITVGSYTLAATPYVTNIGAGGALDDVFYVALVESGSADTDATPAVTVTANTNLKVGANEIATDSPDAWWDAQWLSRTKITFDNTASGVNLTDFPLLVSLTTSDVDFAKIKAGGADIRFVDDDGTSLNYEIETWDDTPGSESATVWVKVQQINANVSTDYIHLYYDNTSASDAQNAAGVWDASHVGVWHLGESGDGTLDEFVDSSGTGNHGQGGAGNAGETPTQTAAGRIGNAQIFDASDDHVTVANDASLGITGDITVSAWVKLVDPSGDWGTILAKYDGNKAWDYEFYVETGKAGANLELYSDDTNPDIVVSNNGVVTDTLWHHVSMTRNGSNFSFYVDGADAGTDTATGAFGNNSIPVMLGYTGENKSALDANLDEVRLSNTARSADWIEASYLSQNGTFAFNTFDVEEVAMAATDKAAPVILTRETADLDSDGTIDAIHLLFSEAIQDSTVTATDWDVAGVGGEAFSSTTGGDSADDDDIYITFTDGVLDTAATPDVAYVQGTLADLAGNLLATGNANAADKAAPVVLASETADLDSDGFIDAIHVTFSETIQDATVGGANWDVAGVAGDTFVWNANGDTADDADIYITFNDGVLDTGATPVLSYDLNVVADAVGNVQDSTAAWWDVNWRDRAKITFDNTASAENLADFPVLVSLTAADIDFSKIKSGGADIRFVDNDGTLLNYEIESWDDTPGSESATVWIKVQQLDQASTTDYIHMYYNNAAAADAQNAAGVWNVGYKGVWHLGDGDSTAANFYRDSTANNEHGTLIDADGDSTAATGVIGGAYDFNGDADAIQIANFSQHFTNAMTIAGWVKSWDTNDFDGYFGIRNPTDLDHGFYVLQLDGTTDLEFRFRDDAGVVHQANVTSAVTPGAWSYVALTYDGSTLTSYVDGNVGTVNNSASGSFSSAAYAFNIGEDGDGREVNGVIDEVRASNVARSADWIEATYLSQNGTFAFSNIDREAVVTTDKAAPVLLSASSLQSIGSNLFELEGQNLDLVFSETLSAAPTEANLEAALQFAAGASDGDNLPTIGTGANPISLVTTTLTNDTVRVTYNTNNAINADALLVGTHTAQVISGVNITDTAINTAYTGAAAVTINGDANDAPVLDNSGTPTFTTITEDDTANSGDLVSAIVGATITDADAVPVEGIAVTALNSSNGTWQYNTGSGWTDVGVVSDASALLLRSSDSLRFVPDTLDADSASVTYRAWDRTSGGAGAKVNVGAGGGSSAFSVTADTASITVTAVDDPMNVATTGNTVLFTEDAGATTALFAAAMDTVEAGDTVTQMVLTLANVEAGDTLVFGATSVDLNTNGATGPDANGFTYTVSSAGASPVVTISHAGATDTVTNTMLNSAVFDNTTNDDPSTTARTVTLTSVTDTGSGLTADGTMATVNVATVDDPMNVATTGNTVLFTEDAGATTSLFAAAMDTVEAGDTVTQVVLTLANVEAGDTLVFGATTVDLNTNGATGPDANGFTYTVSSAGASPVVTISHAGASDTVTNTMLNSLVFDNTANNDPGTTARTVTLTSVTDTGSGLTADGTVATVNVAKADDPMNVATTGNTVLFTEDAGATTALFAAAMDTVESGDTVTQVVLTLANVEAGDTLLFGATSVDLNTNGATGPDANGFTYTVSSAGASPVVTISHAGASDTVTNTMLNSAVFDNTSNNDPGTTARTVTLTSVTDTGSGLTADGTVATVNVATADDPMNVATTGNTVLFTEDAGATTALFAAAMDTVESGDTVTQVVLTLANVEAGDTLVFGATTVDLNTNGATGPDANGFTYTVSSAGATPVVTISHAGATDTVTNTMLNSAVFDNTANNDPGTTARTVTLTSVTDTGSGLTADGTVATVNVAKADDPMNVATTGNTVLFTEDAGATTALFAAAMDTVESGDTVTQVVLTLANVEAGDTLVFGATSVDLNTNGASGPDANGFTYTVSSAGASPVVTISHAGASDTVTNTMLNSAVFDNTSNNDPSTTARTVTLTSVTDTGSGLTADGTVATVNVATADDPMNVATTGNTVLFTEDAGATTALFAAAMDTVESGDTVTQLVLTLANVEAGDTLVFGATSVDLNTNGATGPDANGFTYTVSSAGASPVVTITHAGATDTVTNTMLNSAVFDNTTNNDPSTTARTVTLTSVTDTGSGLTADGTVATVNVATANDPMNVATTGNTVLFTEDAGATTSLFAAAMDTVESGDTVTQLVLTLANVEAGDTLLFGATSVDLNTNGATGPDANGFTYTVSSAGASPVVTITHAGASDTVTNTMLNSAVFDNTSNNDPSTTARTVTLTSVTDTGSGLTADGTVATVNVATADDPMNVATTGNTVLFTEDAGATTALFAAAMDTVESGDTVTQVVLTLANVEAGDTLLFGATSVDLNTNGASGPDANGFTYTVSSAGASPVVTISHAGATDTVTNTMLNSAVFDNTSNNDPSTTARTVTLTSVTDSGSGLTADGTVATVNVATADDPMNVATTGNTVLFTEDAGATTALFAAAMDTVESGDTVTQVVLTLANVEAGDTLLFGATSVDLNTNGATGPDANGFTYTVSSAGASPVVTITHAGATDSVTNTMLNSAVFDNTTNNDPSTTARTVTLTSVTDTGSGLTADGTVATVNVAKADDPMNVATTGNTVLFTEDAGATTALFAAAMDTVESGDTVTQVVLTLANVEAGDTLVFGATTVDLNTNGASGPDANGFTYTVSSAGASPVVTISHAGATDTVTNTMLNSAVFDNTTNNDPGTTARTVTLTSVTDTGSGLTADGTVATVNVATADDPMNVATTGNTVLFTEDAGATTSLFAAAMDTVESGDTVTQVVLTLANVEAGDTLVFGATSVDLNTNGATGPDANGFTYTVSSAGASPVVTISHAGATDTVTNTMLNSAVFDNTANNDPGTTARTVTLTSVTDTGSGLTADGTVATVNVAKADDPMNVATTGNTVLFTEDAGATTALFAAAMDTVESGDTVTQVVLTLANVEAGDTLVFGATSVDLNTNGATGPDANGFTYTVSSAGASPVVTISHAGASDTVTNTMLNSAVFDNTSNDDPGTTARTVTLTSVTDTGSGLTADGTVATVNVATADDPMNVATTGNTVLFTEDAGATTALFAAAMDTVEAGDTVTQVVLTLANVEAGDLLRFGATTIDLNTDGASGPDAGGFTYTVSSAGASPVVTISHAGASDTVTNTMLNSAVFDNTANNDPSTTARTVTLTSVTDTGSGLTADGTVATVNIATADDPMNVATTGNTVLFTEDAGVTTSLFAAAMDTVEAGDTVTQVVLTLANVEAGDTLVFGATTVDLNTNGASGPDANGFTYTVSSAGASPVVTISHAGATDTVTNTMLNSAVFDNTTNNDPSTTARTITLTSVTDTGSGLTADGTVATVNVATADDPMNVATTGNTVLFTEDAGATTSLFAAAMDTVESGDTVTQLVLTLANVEAGDTLVFGATSVDLNTNGATGPDANGFTYTVSSAGASPVVTISHAGASDTVINTMLNSAVFDNTANNDPGITARTVTLTSVTDTGSGLTADGTVATVNVATADDPMNVATTGNTVLFTEDAGATTALFAAAMDTVESGDTVTQLVLTLANVEAGDTLVFGATSVDLNTNGATGPDANGFTYTVSSAGASPVVTISHVGATDTVTNTMLNSAVFDNTSNDDPGTTARTVTLTSVTDTGSGLTADGTVATVNVAKADDPMNVATTGNTVLFTEDAGATTALFAAAMDTVESGDTVTQVVLTLANVEAGDTLVFGATSVDLNTNGATGPDANGFTYTVSSAGASPVVTISHAGASDTVTNTMLNSAVFDNTSNNDPGTTARTVTLTSVTDTGSGLTADGTVATVNVATADDPMNVATTGNTVLFTEDAGATTALFAAAMDTVESGDTVTQVVLTLANVEAGDTLVFGATSVDLNTNGATGPDANGFTYTVSSAGASPVVTISHAGATDTLTNTMLNSAVFDNTANNDPGTTARTVTLTSVTDTGSGLTADGTVATVNVAKADDPMNVATTGNTVLFTEDAGATTALFAAAMDTVESGDTVTQVVLTLANVEAGDTLVFGATSVDLNTNGATGPDANGFTYTVSSAGASPVVTISHAGATDTVTNTMLNSAVFDNTSNNDPGTTARTVTLTSVTDTGSGLTADGTVATVNVATADDPMNVATTGNTVLFTEDAGATTALFAAAMDTVEAGDTVTQLVLTLANVEAGDTLVFGATSVDLNTNGATGPDANGFTYTVSSAGASPVVTISHAGATDTVTNTMLNSAVFDNTSNNDPSTTARTVTLTSVTDTGSGLTADGTVATVNVATADDPMNVATTGNTVLFTEDAGATTALFAAAMDTVESGDTVTQVVLTLANVEAGDTLVFGATSVDLNTNGATGPDANGFTYTVSSAGASPVVTITHAGATDTVTNTMLNSAVFDNTTNNDPSTTARTVTLTSVTDTGSGLTADGTVATVNVATADDPINVATTGNTVLFTEDAGVTTALFAAAMDTVESGDTVTQVVLTLANVEAGDTLVFGATSVDLNTNGATGPDANGFTYTVSSAGASPVVTVSHAGASDTVTNTMLNSAVFDNTTNDDPGTTARTVTLTSVTDTGSGLTADGTVATVNVATADDPMNVATTGNTVLFTEDAGATTALFAAAMDTVESGDTVTQVVLTLANVEAGDTLVFGATTVDLNTNGATGPDANGFTYTVSSAGASPVVTISHAGATDTVTNTMLNSAVFDNTANNDPGTTARTVTLTSVTDTGSGLTADGTVATVNVATADDPMNVATTGNTVLFTEDAGATTALFAAAMDTVESGDTVTQLVLTLANVEAGDTLVFGATSVDLNTNGATGPDANGFTYTVSSAGASPVVTISHVGATDTVTNTMLNSAVFDNTSNDDPGTTARTVTLTSVTDTGSGLTADGTVATVNVAKADDPMNVATTGNTVLFTEDAGATTALFAAAMDTVESGDTVTQVVLTLANVEAGDTLMFGATSVDLNTNGASGPDANGFTYTVSSAGASPVVTISHAGASDTVTNTMLNSAVFDNTSNNDPGTTARTVTLTSVTDTGSGLTADGTVATVNVATADDPMNVATTGNTVLFTEDAGATTALFAAAMDTVEAGDTVTQVVLTLANVEAGDTLVFGATTVDLNTNGATGPDANGFTYTVSSAGASPVVTISHAGATDTVTNTMLNSAVFDNTANNDPGTTARTVTLTSVTDTGSGLTADGTVATVNVAKADDPMNVATTGNTVLFTEDAGATTALFAAAMDTVESGDTVTQVVLTLANVEAGDTLVFGATSVDLNTNGASGPDANGFTYTVSSAGASPVVTISHAGASDTVTNTMLNSAVFDNTANNDPSTTARTVTLTSVTDTGSGLTADGTVATVNIATADDPMNVATTGNTVLFTEDAGVTTSLFAAAMDTVESGDTVTQLVLTLANVEAGDTLVFGVTSVDLNTNGASGPDANGFTYTVSSAGASPVVTISHAGASDTVTNTMLNSAVFDNTANNDPGTTARTVTLTSVTDTGSGLTADGTVATVNVATADDPMNVATTGNTVLFTEDAGATTALFAAAMDTVESGDTVTQVVLTLANVEAGDTLVFGATSVDLNTNGATGPDANGFTYTVSSAGASPVVTISHAGATDTVTNTMLNSAVFDNTANNDPSTTARTVTLTSVTDSGSGLTADGTVATVNVATADDPMNVATTGNTVLFTEDAGATTALFAAAMDTVESGDTVTQVVLTLANVEAGDTLLFGATSVDLNTNGASGPDANGFTYTVSSAGASPVVTISHAGATDTVTNTMLNSAVFDNTANNDPGTTARTVTLTSVTDTGSGLTAGGTVATVNVATADDPMNVATTGNTVLFTEDAGATTALFAAAMDTVESGDTVTQVSLTLANVEAGDTLVFGATTIDLNTNGATGPDANGFTYTVSSAGASPVVTISHAGASDTVTNTMLNSAVFDNTSNNDPSTTARTVTLTSVTDTGSGLTADGTVATVNVATADDPMNVATTGNTVLFTEDAGATTALFAAAMDTVESGDTVTQVVLTLANVEAGDTLVFGATSVDLNTNGATGPDANGFTYTVSSAGASPVVTITHAGASDTVTNTMLNSAEFDNTANNNPSTTARTVTLTSVTDSGSGLTADGTVATVNVVAANDAPVGIPTITGTVTEDQILTADTSGISDADGLGAFSYQWLRGGGAIGGATASTYTLGDADVGTLISVEVSYTDGSSTAEGPLTSAQTVAVTNINDAPTGAVSISGIANEAQVLSASNTLADADGLGAISYQWQRNAVDIAAATAGTYTLVGADVGTTISVVASYTDAQATAESVSSAGVGPITNVNNVAVGVPTIAGTVQEDQILTADTSGISDADGLGAFSYQWLRGGVAIGGATASTYTLGDADVGTQMSVQVSFTDGDSTAEGPLTSAQTAAVSNVNDAPVGLPTITGTVTEDQILTADTSGISDADGLGAFSYQWLRGGVAIGGASASTYTLGDADVGTQISVRANYTDGQGTSESPTSTTVGPVVNINDAPIGSANTVTTLQDTAFVFSPGDFGFSDPNDNPANNLLAVRIAALPTAGTLTDNGVPVVAGQFVNVADINAGWLVFTPTNGANGAAYATFTFQVQDDGAGSDMDLIARTVTVNVNVDAPRIGIVPLPDITPPPVVVTPPPVGSGTDPQDTPPDDDPEKQPEETMLAVPGGSSSAPGLQSQRVSEVLQNERISRTQPVLVPDLQQTSTKSDGPIKADGWEEYLASLNISPNTTQQSVEEISAILHDYDFGEIPDEQFFTLESGLQLSGLALSAGFVSWAVRGAGLFASLLTSLPAWRHMDPLPVLKEDEKEKEKNSTLREDDDDHEIDDEGAVGDLWMPGGAALEWSDTAAAILSSSGQDASNAGADLTMTFLEHVAPRADASEPARPAEELEGFA